MPKSSSGLRANAKYYANRPGDYDEDTGTYGGWEPAFQVGDRERFDSPGVERRWNDFVDEFNETLTREDEKAIMRDGRFGFIMTGHSFDINEKLYDPANAGKSDEEIFTQRDSRGRLRDLQTVKALDRVISTGKTPRNAVFTRFSNFDAIKSLFELNGDQVRALMQARRMPESEVKKLSAAMKGTISRSKSYTCTSGNRRLNVFRSSPVERKLYVPQGTNAFAVRRNIFESEVTFGRGVRTELMGITVSKDGHLVLHERFIGYKK